MADGAAFRAIGHDGKLPVPTAATLLAINLRDHHPIEFRGAAHLQVATAPVGDWVINEITRFPPIFSNDPIVVQFEIALNHADHVAIAQCCMPDEIFECPEWGDQGKHWALFGEDRIQCAIDLCLALTRGTFQ